MGAPRILGVLFDKDGTLFDFDKSWGAFGRRVIYELAQGEPTLSRDLAAAAGVDAETGGFRAGSPIVAGSLLEICEAWAPMLPGWSVDALVEWLAAEAEAMSPHLLAPAAEDLPALLDRLRSSGYALGVATNDSAAAARAQLAGVLDRFVFLAGFDSGHGAKPEPGMIHAFAAATGAPTSAVVMVGDSLHDLFAARAAGCAAAVGVLTGPAGRHDLAPHADAVLPSIADLPGWLAAFDAA